MKAEPLGTQYKIGNKELFLCAEFVRVNLQNKYIDIYSDNNSLQQ